jgi:hypothetical protein
LPVAESRTLVLLLYVTSSSRVTNDEGSKLPATGVYRTWNSEPCRMTTEAGSTLRVQQSTTTGHLQGFSGYGIGVVAIPLRRLQ